MSIRTVVRNPQHHASDNAANAAGFTRHMIAAGRGDGCYGTMAVLVKPDADLDTMLLGFDTDNQEWVIVAGFNVDWRDAA